MSASRAILALIFALAASGDIVSAQVRCPYPVAGGTKLSSLPRGCYNITDEVELYIGLTNFGDTPCSQNYVLDTDNLCRKVVLRILNQTPKKNKSPEGVPNW